MGGEIKEVIFVLQGYDEVQEDGRLKNVVTFELYAHNEKEAIEKAEKYLVKKNYRVSSVIEK